MSEQKMSWRQSLLSYRHPRVIAMLFFGFSAGLPYLLVFSTLSAWLRDEGVSRTTIGFFSWVGILFSIKVFWAPVIDSKAIPWLTRSLGQRRSWMLVAQVGIAASLVSMAMIEPTSNIETFARLAVLVAFCSATQDICIDAYRIEAVQPELQASMAATYIFGYRLAMLVAGAGAFYIADWASWGMAYLTMAGFMVVGVITTFVVSEPEVVRATEADPLQSLVIRWADYVPHIPWILPRHRVAWFLGAVVTPFVEFFKRNGWYALTILLFISVFRISDITMGVMANPFYLDMGYQKKEIASVAKIFGFFMTIAGSFLGGVLVARFGLFRPLVIGSVMVALTNLIFAWMAGQPHDIALLATVISADNLAGGISNVVFIAYLSSLTNTSYTATQYALFSSIMTLPGKFIGGFSGIMVDANGYEWFFVYASVLGIPAIGLAIYLMWRERVGLRGVPQTT
ncbi:AmpG family muropeptide MFS transporter [Gammaproteobacteria bacterium 45_16_T64]|nr:AmpG family muropeptide MFS transporter [Gammaproteobacteria bacterium 45_16_T64]